MNQMKTRIIIIMLVILMIILCTLSVVLFITTDMFKSNEMLFKKYISQNLKNVADTVDISSEENIIDYLQNNDYIERTDANLKYLESENDEEEYNWGSSCK